MAINLGFQLHFVRRGTAPERVTVSLINMDSYVRRQWKPRFEVFLYFEGIDVSWAKKKGGPVFST